MIKEGITVRFRQELLDQMKICFTEPNQIEFIETFSTLFNKDLKIIQIHPKYNLIIITPDGSDITESINLGLRLYENIIIINGKEIKIFDIGESI